MRRNLINTKGFCWRNLIIYIYAYALNQVSEGYLHVCMCMTKSQDRESIPVAGVQQAERNDHHLPLCLLISKMIN